MARFDGRYDVSPARRPFTGHGAGVDVSTGTAQAAARKAQDEASGEDAAPRARHWTLDRIERIIGSIA